MNETEDARLRPILHTSRSFYVFSAILVVVSLWFVYAYSLQLRLGLSVTALNDIVIWGVYISNFVFFIGISHAGIAISAAVRIMNLEDYKPIVRMAELLTIVSLMMAGLSIVIDLGRPDRVFHLIRYWTDRIGTSPLVWDITAVATYLILSATYLYLSLRGDIHICMNRCDGWRRRLYRLLLPWYEEGERETVHRLTRWMAVTILPVMVMVHTTVAWIFGLISSRPLWFGAVAGPYFVAAAVASGISTVVVIAATLRSVFHWEDIIKPRIFRGLGNFLAVIILIYLYFMLAEQLTAGYAGPAGEFYVSVDWLYGDYAWLFWPMTIFGMLVPCLMLLAQALKPGRVNIGLTASLSLIVVGSYWIKRYLIIVPTMTRGAERIVYAPTWVELSIIAGTFALPMLLYTVFIKLFPIIELGEMGDG